MQSGKKKSKPLNLLKPVALPSQVLQDDQIDKNSRIEQSNRKPMKIASGSLNLIAEASTQENQGEKDSQEGYQTEQSVKDSEQTLGGSLSLVEQIFRQSDQSEINNQFEQRKMMEQEIRPLNIIEQAFVKSEKNKENGQNICKKVRRTKNSNRPLNIIKGAFDL